MRRRRFIQALASVALVPSLVRDLVHVPEIPKALEKPDVLRTFDEWIQRMAEVKPGKAIEIINVAATQAEYLNSLSIRPGVEVEEMPGGTWRAVRE